MTADEFRDAAILGRIVEGVESDNRFCGETLLQKSAYFLKEMFGAPISSPFRIYYYGPYSFDLHDTLGRMEALDIVRARPHEWGRKYGLGPRYAQVKNGFPKTLERVEPAIQWIIRELAPLGVKELEPLATALFLKRERPADGDDALARRLHEIKPHVSVDSAERALKRVREWMASRT